MNDLQIELKDVCFEYEKNQCILDHINFTLEEKESIGIIGANGMGKSTLLKLLVGLEMDFTGRILVKNSVLEKKNLSAIRKSVGYVFQDTESQIFMTKVYDEIAFAPKNYGCSKVEVEKRVRNALEMTKITHLQESILYKLSGGEKKLVAIATILAMEPDIILMDEPTIALDPQNRRNLIRILNQLEQPKIIASHDLDMILDTCTRVILLSRGRIVKDGAAKEILYDKELLEKNSLELPLTLQKTKM